MGTRLNRLSEVVLTCTHNLCFEQKYENSKKYSTENCHFYSREKSLYLAWACFLMYGKFPFLAKWSYSDMFNLEKVALELVCFLTVQMNWSLCYLRGSKSYVNSGKFQSEFMSQRCVTNKKVHIGT